jgi:hypothetical protein
LTIPIYQTYLHNDFQIHTYYLLDYFFVLKKYTFVNNKHHRYPCNVDSYKHFLFVMLIMLNGIKLHCTNVIYLFNEIGL